MEWLCILTGGGFSGYFVAEAAIKAKTRQFWSAMMGLIFSFLLNLTTQLVYNFEVQAKLPDLDDGQRYQAKSLLTSLWWLVFTESILQCLFLIYAFCRVDKRLRNLTDGQKTLLTSAVILDDVILQTIYNFLAIMLWINNDYGNGVPLAGVLISSFFGYVIAVVELIQLREGNYLSENRQAQYAFLLRLLATVMTALCDILFFLDSKSELEDMSNPAKENGLKANEALLVFICLGLICSIPVYLTPFCKDCAERIIAVEYYISMILGFFAVVNCCIVYFMISNGSKSLLVSVICSFSMSSFIQAYDWADLIDFARKGVIDETMFD